MAIEVQVTTTDATQAVTSLATGLERLANAADSFNNTKLGSGLAREFKELRDTLNTFKDAVAGTSSVFAEMQNQTNSVTGTNKQLKNSVEAVKDAILSQTAALKVQGAVLRETVNEQEALSKSQREASKYLELQKTSQQKVAAELKKFRDIASENNITGREHARIVELITQKHKGAGLEIERVGERLKKQTSLWGKSNIELLKATSGWDLLSGRMQKSIIYQQKTADAQKILTSYLKEEMTALQQHEAAYETLMKVRQNGFLKGKEQETLFLELKKNILTAIENEKRAQEGLNNSRAKHAVQTQTGDDYAAAVRNLDKLRDSLYIIPKVATETDSYRKSVAALNDEQKKEHATLTQLQADMKLLAPLYQRALSPLEKYKQTVDAATRANQRYIATNGKMGISTATFTTITNKARLEFAKTQAATIGLNRGIFSLVGGFNTLTQVTAAGRAAMIGAGQSFGIFEGRTIAVAAAVYTLARAIKSSIAAGSEFEYLTDQVSVLTLSLDALTAWDGAKGTALGMMQGLRKETAFLREEMVQLAQDTQFSSQEVAEAAAILARSGQDTLSIYTNLSPVLDLAAIAMTDMANAADIATGLLASFNDGSTTLERAVDVLAVTSIKSKATIDDLGLSIQYIGPMAAQAGMSIEETAAILGVLADVNIRGSKAGTALRRVLINLQAPSKKAKEALEGLGIDYKNLELGERGLQKVFEQLSKQGATMEQLRSIFGVYAISAATALTSLSGNIGEFNDELDKAAGSAAKMRDLLRTGLKMQFEELASTMEAVQVTAFEMFGGALTEQISRLSQHLEDNRERYALWISETVKGLAEAVKWIVENIGLLAKLAKTYVALKVASSVILGLVSYWKLLGVTSAGAGAAIRGTVAATMMATSGFGALSGAMAVAAGAARALWIAIGGGVGLAIVALTGLFYWLTSTSSAADEKFIPSLSSAGQVVDQFGDRLHTLPTEKLDQLLERLNRDVELNLPLQLADATEQLETELQNLARLEKLRDAWAQELSDLDQMTLETGGDLSSLVQEENLTEMLLDTNRKILEAKSKIGAAQDKVVDLSNEELDIRARISNILHAQQLGQANEYEAIANRFKALGIEDQYQFYITLARELKSEIQGVAQANEFLNMNLDMESYDEVSARIKFLEGFVKQLGENSIFARFAMGILWKEGFKDPIGTVTSMLASLKEHLKTLSPTDNKPDPEIAKAASELKKYFDAYEKAKGPVYAVNRELAEVDRWIGEINSKSPKATAAMKEAGIGMADAMAALNFAKEDLSLGFLEATLGGVDSSFKDLRKTLEEVEIQELSLEESTQLLWKTLNDPKNEKVVKALGGVAEAFNRSFLVIAKVKDGSATLQKEWNKLSKEAAEFEVSITGTEESLEALVKKYAQLKGVSETAARSTLALVTAKELLGDSLKKTADESETLSKVHWALDDLIKKETITVERAVKAYNLLWASQPIGKLEAEIIQRKAQIQLIGQGAREQAIYNAAVAQFGANWMYADQAFKDAAGRLYDVNRELERATELQDTYREFGDGVIGIFADMASGMETSFSNAANSLRDLMKKLLRDLIYMALKNKIMVGLGMEGSGSGSGNSSIWGWAQNLMNFFGGGKNAARSGGSIASASGSLIGYGSFGTAAGWSSAAAAGPPAALAGGASGGSAISGIFSAANWVKAGKGLWNGFSGMLYGTGQVTQMGAMLGTPMYGPGMATQWAPTGLGAAGLAVAGIGGAYYGYQRSGNLVGAAGYGALGMGVAGAAMSAAAGTSMIAGATGAFASLGGAAFIPVLGWILAIAAVVDMVAGGKLFGTKYRPESITSALNLSEEGGRATQSRREVRNRALFQGRRWRDVEMEVSPEMEAAAQQFYNQVYGVMSDAAARLATDTPPMIDAALRTVTEYDKKGREKATKYFVDVLGRTWEEETAELASTRITAEAIIAVIDSVFQTVANSIPDAPEIPEIPEIPGPPGFRIGDRGDNQQVRSGYARTLTTIANMAGEASQIAERWRDDAEMLLSGAQFLLLAATDIRKGFGLLKDEGGLTEIADLIESLAKAGESLSDTYTRVYQSTTLLDQAFELAGATTDKSRVEFVKFATQVTEAMGGMDEATQKWNAFYSAFYSAGELAQYQQEQMLRQGGLAFAGIGLNFEDFMSETGLADFRKLYEEALPTLTPAQVAQWVDAGIALAQFTEAMRSIDDVIQTNATNLAREQMTSFERDMASLADDFQALREEAEALGATTEQLAVLDGQYAEARQRLAAQYREEISNILEDNEFALQREGMTEYQLAVRDITTRFDEMRDKLIDLGATSEDLMILESQRVKTMEQLTAQLRKQLDDFMISQDPTMGFVKLVNDLEAARKQAVALGASEAQLTRLRKIAELEMARFVADLRRSIASSIEGLSEYLGLSSQIEGNYESSRDMAEDLYELERRRYEMAQKAIENITKYLKDLETGDLAPGDWRSRLGAGRSNFDEMLELARSGDENALNEITRYADTLLKLGKETLGDTQAYSNLYDYVTGSLRDLMADLALIPAVPDAPTGGDSSGSGSVSGSTTGGMSDVEAYWAILELATQIGSLSVATNQSVYTLLDEFGIPLLTLTQGMGVNLSNLDMEGLNSLSLLATSFNTNLPEMLNELGANPQRVAELLGVNLEDVRLGILTGFDGLAEYLGVSIPEALEYVGISVAELAPAFGLYIDNLSEGTLANLGLMADALGILPTDLAELLGIPLADIATSFGYELGLSSEENFRALRTLATSLGLSLFDLGEAIGEDFGTIVQGLNTDLSSVFEDLPEGIGPEVKENLEDLLNNVATSANPKEVQDAVGNLLAFTRDNLPGSFATSLATMLADMGLGVVEEHGFTDIYTRLGDVETSTTRVEDTLRNTINLTLHSGFNSVVLELENILGVLNTPAAIETPPEIAGWGSTEDFATDQIGTPSPGDQYMETKALEMERDTGLEDLYTRLEESQAQVEELTEKLTEATESLSKLQEAANQRLGKIASNTRQTAKRTKETKKA